MQYGKVDPATCETVDYCPEATPPKTNSDYIERDKVLEAILNLPPKMDEQGYGWLGRVGVWQMIFDFQSADVAPVVHGKNLDRETPSIFTCSVCGWHSWDTYCGDTSEYNYCPNCGARMDGET